MKSKKKPVIPNPTKQQRSLKEDIFHRIVESAPNAIVLVNSEGTISLVNEQTEKLFGYPREELLGKSVEMLVPTRYKVEHPKYRANFLQNPTTREMGAGRDLFGLHKNGLEIPVEIGIKPIENDNEIFVLASIIDITQRKNAEEKFRRVVESVPNAIVLVNLQGSITLVNERTEILFGYSRTELVGQPIEILVPERFRSKHPGYRDLFFMNPSTREMGSGRDLYGLHKDGSEIPVEIGLNPFKTEDGTLVLASIIDITERKNAQIQKQQEKEIAEQRSRELIRLAELERFQKLTIGRELKMIELKKEITELRLKLTELKNS